MPEETKGIYEGVWKVVKENFKVEVGEGAFGQYAVYTGQPYEAIFESGGRKLFTLFGYSARRSEILFEPPCFFIVEDHELISGRRDASFLTPEELEKWLVEQGVKAVPDVRSIYKRLVEFAEEIADIEKREARIDAEGEI